jgi:hypothetical protein
MARNGEVAVPSWLLPELQHFMEDFAESNEIMWNTELCMNTNIKVEKCSVKMRSGLSGNFLYGAFMIT